MRDTKKARKAGKAAKTAKAGKTGKRSTRKAPIESATSLPEGTIKDSWVIKQASNGTPRWVPETSVELNGFKLFTVDIAKKHIGKLLTVYSREYKRTWPSKNAWTKPEDSTHIRYTFVPNGDAIIGKTVAKGWLKSGMPAIKKGTQVSIDGPLNLCSNSKCEYMANGLLLDSYGGKKISDDLMGSDMFVRV
jgi:hypothetical protein